MGNCCSEEDEPYEDQGGLLANEALSASTSQVVPTTPGDVATKHPNESYGEFYTRKGRGLTYDKVTAGQLKKAKENADNIAKALKEEQEREGDTRADRSY